MWRIDDCFLPLCCRCLGYWTANCCVCFWQDAGVSGTSLAVIKMESPLYVFLSHCQNTKRVSLSSIAMYSFLKTFFSHDHMNMPVNDVHLAFHRSLRWVAFEIFVIFSHLSRNMEDDIYLVNFIFKFNEQGEQMIHRGKVFKIKEKCTVLFLLSWLHFVRPLLFQGYTLSWAVLQNNLLIMTSS